MKELTVIKYIFIPYFNGYFMNGEFYSENNKMLKKKYYNGRICINYNNKRYGINKLRKFAKRIEVKKEILPF